MASNSGGKLEPKSRPFRSAGYLIVQQDDRRILRHTRKKRVAKKHFLAERNCYGGGRSGIGHTHSLHKVRTGSKTDVPTDANSTFALLDQKSDRVIGIYNNLTC